MNMNSILSISKTGLTQLQKSLDNTANNIANVNTVGFKANEMSFRELLNNPTTNREVEQLNNPQNIDFNAGLQTNVQAINFTQGSLASTGLPTDLAISGDGFFRVFDAAGNQFLTRDGAFRLDSQNQLVNQQGYRVDVTYTIPSQNWPNNAISINSQGIISTRNNDQTIELGRVNLFLPTRDSDLSSVGKNLFQLSPGAIVANNIQNPNLFGNIMQGYIEQSNVNLAQEMTDMIVTQRSFSLNAKAIQATDDMLNSINHFTD